MIIKRKTKPIYVTLGGFPGSSSTGKDSTCNAGDPGLTPGSGSSPGEGIGYPLEYSWASLVAQMAKNQSAMPEIWVQSLGWEDPLEKEMQPTPIFLPEEAHGQRSLVGYTQSMGSQRVRHELGRKMTE